MYIPAILLFTLIGTTSGIYIKNQINCYENMNLTK